jgi:hypothetical protein
VLAATNASAVGTTRCGAYLAGGANQIAADTGLSQRTIKRARAGAAVGKNARAKLTRYTATYARQQLSAAGIGPPRDDLAALAAYRDHCNSHAAVCEGCGQPLTGRQTRWRNNACRMRAVRTQDRVGGLPPQRKSGRDPE